MPAFHPKELWEKTGRWNTMDDLYKVSDSSGREVALGPTHEEVVTPLVGTFIPHIAICLLMSISSK